MLSFGKCYYLVNVIIWLILLQSNRLGLAKFVRYNPKFVVNEFINVVNMNFGTEKMEKIYSS